MPISPNKTAWTAELIETIERESLRAGFDACGLASAEATGEGDRFARWVDSGYAGEMEWLKRRDAQGTLLRESVQVALPWARSIIVCAMNYQADAPRSIDPAAPRTGWIGRYAWSGHRRNDEVVPTDYHDDLLARLRLIETVLQQHAPCQTACYVDTGPLVERAAATKAGIGWIGKNTCVLRQDIGSWMLLGVIVSSLPIRSDTPIPALAADRCGSCTRCLDACPTGALIAPREMDASLCIAYLTIEKKGEIAEELRGKMGRQVFGCDICQDVCPWNSRAPIAQKPGLETRTELINPELSWLAELDSAGFRRLFEGSPLERTGKKRLHRNVAIAMGNSGDPLFIPRLEAWSTGDDPVLAASAAWALARLREAPSPSANLNHQSVGTDADQYQ